MNAPLIYRPCRSFLTLLVAFAFPFLLMPASARANTDLSLYKELEQEKETLGKLLRPAEPIIRVEALDMKGYLEITINDRTESPGTGGRDIYIYDEFYRIDYRFIRSVRYLSGAESIVGNCTSVDIRADNQFLSIGGDGVARDSRRDRARYLEQCRRAENIVEALHGIAGPTPSVPLRFVPMSGRNIVGVLVQAAAKTYGLSLGIGHSVPFADCTVNEGKVSCSPGRGDAVPLAGVLPVSFTDVPVPSCRNPLTGMKDIQVAGYLPATRVTAKLKWHFDNYCGGTPMYEPGYWNDGPGIDEILKKRRCDGGPRQCLNNCYNYAANRRTDTYAQPGLRAGIRLEEDDYNCDRVYAAAVADGLKPPDASGSCPSGTTKVALAVRQEWDYHWYRQDADGMWSHKLSTFPASNLDNAHKPISDPGKADTGRYEFCGYLCSCSDKKQGQGHEDIRGDRDAVRR